MDRETFEKIYGKGTKLFELAWFQKNLHLESERGQTLIVAAFLEDMVERALRTYLPNQVSTKFLLDGATAPIGTFASKIHLACSLGFVTDKEFVNLEIVRKIRNKFAHTVEMSFGNESIVSLTKNLDYALDRLDADQTTKPEAPFQRFQLATAALLLHLHDRAEKSEKRQLSEVV